MTFRFTPDDPRIDQVVDLLLGFPDGLPMAEVVTRVPLSASGVSHALRAGQHVGRVVKICASKHVVLWAAVMHAPALRTKYQALSLAKTRERHRRNRATYNARELARETSGLPVKQCVVSKWKPVRVPPGPVSIFDLGAHHAQ